MPTDSVNITMTIVIVLKYNGGMYIALAMYMLCLYSHTTTTLLDIQQSVCTKAVHRYELDSSKTGTTVVHLVDMWTLTL